jgi:hypothetical protein
MLSIVAGIMDLERELGVCEYAVSSPDLNPAGNYLKLPLGCRIANAAGVMVMLAALTGLYALYDLRTKRVDEIEKTLSLLDNVKA